MGAFHHHHRYLRLLIIIMHKGRDVWPDPSYQSPTQLIGTCIGLLTRLLNVALGITAQASPQTRARAICLAEENMHVVLEGQRPCNLFLICHEAKCYSTHYRQYTTVG